MEIESRGRDRLLLRQLIGRDRQLHRHLRPEREVDGLELRIGELLLGGVDFSELFLVLKDGAKAAAPYHTLADAKAAGAVTLNLGLFLNSVISFTIVAFALFILVKAMNQLRKEKVDEVAPVTTKSCPHCCSEIPLQATRCPHCTSALN